MPKFNIITLGCKVNQAESEGIAEDLLDSEWSATTDCAGAEVCIVNTCTVTHKASMQSRQAVRQAIRANPGARIVVTGCYAQTAPQELDKIDGVDYVVGHDKKLSIRRLLDTNENSAGKMEVSSFRDIRQERQFHVMKTATSASRTRPFLKIQDGCDAFCTYCIVPYARGRSRSMPVENVLQSIEELAGTGFLEVVLTGIHLGAYGRDLQPAENLGVLLNRIETQKAIPRIRISSLEPFELTPEVIQQVADSNIFCRHFHIPLQSGDDSILKKMGRPYTSQEFGALINRIHRLMPDAAIGVDTLIGFPGESRAAFDNTYRLIKDLPVSYLHVFPFSSRQGTPAAKMPDKIDPPTLKSRSAKMRELGGQKRLQYCGRFVGKSVDVLIETNKDSSTGLLKGISSNYLPVLLDGPDELQNKIVEVKIKKLEDGRIYGVLCN